jgi:hypothetical protein
MPTTIEMLTQRVEVLEKQMATLLKTDHDNTKTDDKPKKTKTKTKTKTKKDENDDKPKQKRVSGYLLFSKVTRDDVKQELFGDDKPKNSDIMVELGKRWKALEDDEREEWNRQAKEQASDSAVSAEE